MHDLDRLAFDALNQFPKFAKLQEAYINNVDERAAKIEFLSSAIRLGENQLTEIYNLLSPICEKLGIENMPDLYMVKSANKQDINAFTGGITVPFVCVTSELVKQFPLELVSSVIAHECGHIACKHYLYHSLARNFANGIEASPLSVIPRIRRYLSRALVTALLFWDRCSELSADRAAVLCDGSSEKTVDMLLKIHGFDENINRDEFIKQALDLKDFVNDSTSNKMMEQMLTQWDSHPLLATRAYECCDWANSSRFKEIVDGSVSVEEIRTERNKKEYHGVSVSIIAYLDRTKVPVSIDIGFGDIIYPDRVKMDFPVLLDMEVPEIFAYSISSVISEKFEAIVSLGDANSRYKDFYDIFILADRYDFDGIELKEAIRETFEHRGTGFDDIFAFTDDFLVSEIHQSRWKAFLKKKKALVNVELEKVVSLIKTMLLPIVDSIVSGTEYTSKWDHTLRSWK